MTQVNITTSTRRPNGYQTGNSADWFGKEASDATPLRSAGQAVIRRFWTFVQRTETCWLWTAGKDAYGYGQIARPGKSPLKTHRLSWMIAHGNIHHTQHVLHHCDVRNCVRPSHLFLGNQDINMKDAVAKGRLGGARPGQRVVSAEQEQEILAVYAEHAATRRLPNGLRERLAVRYGVSPIYISLIGRRRRVRPAVGLRARQSELQQHLNKPVNGRQG